MNTRHLGNAYDFMKKDILRTLKDKLKKKVYVLPMFTDEFNGLQLTFYMNWTSADGIYVQQFRRDTDRNQIALYFNDFDRNNNKKEIIFLDPDKGIKHHSSIEREDKETCIHYDEVRLVLNKCELLVIYDHSVTRDNSNRAGDIREKMNELRTIEGRDIHCFYLDAQACFAFISRNKDLLEEAMICLLREQVIHPERLVN